MIKAIKAIFSKNRLLLYSFLMASVLYMELIVKLACIEKVSFWGFLYTGLFSISLGFIISFLLRLFNPGIGMVLGPVFIAILMLLSAGQIVYFKVFNTFATLYSVFAGTDALTKFWAATYQGIKDGSIYILLLSLPLFVFFLMKGKLFNGGKGSVDELFVLGFSGFTCHLLTVILIFSNGAGIMPMSYLYSKAFVPNLSVSNFGVFTTVRLDAKHLIVKREKNSVGDKAPDDPVIDEEEKTDLSEAEYGFNVTDIDFESLIEGEKNSTVRDMHKYFSEITPSGQNEYTGLFKGKNLIWIVGEAFSTLALNEATTPTLNRLAGEGFVFDNFYNPIFNVSTSDGEYVTLTGLLPKSGVWSFKESAKNFMPYGMGNLLKPLGYIAKAYHNHYYSYYNRHQSHPNLGYDYKGLGNGLKVTEIWPESDLEMMQVTVPKDIKEPLFHNYYMTVSGHLNYNFSGNNMAQRHRNKTEGLEYTEAGKAYLACNVELELAISYLLEQLEAEGKLEDTVIVLSGDHYPYGLKDGEMDDLAGYELEKKFEKFKSTLIIWSGSMKETVKVEKVCSSLDIMPTVANLMGLEFDSRLLAGRDILSNEPGLVEFNDRSFITDQGKYNASENVFIPNPGVSVGDKYAVNILARVNKSFEYSAKILEYDYYRKIMK